ncbi:MAG: PAS domain S-box protein [Hyphomicrobiales bacterium]|nr:PAS domain S-box protein [Hyphomicrobiales bacterium]MDE2286504.1 PAS domain S-box protein [Hyphomicrobiales bacterium]
MKQRSPDATGPIGDRAAPIARGQSYDKERPLLAAIVNASRDAIWSWDSDGIITSWNAEAERLFGYTADEIVGTSMFVMVPDDRLELAGKAVGRLMKGEYFGQYETVRLRKDGVRIDVELTVSPIYGPAGEITGAATVCRDITQRKDVESQLRHAIEAAQHAQERQSLLINELNHRVKNTLATVQSLAVMTSKTKSPHEFADAFSRRLQALSATHDLLTRSGWQYALLGDVVASELKPYMSARIAITPSPTPILLTPKQVLSLGLVFHELATNAAKHGALAHERGALDVSWQQIERNGRKYLAILWHERGGAPFKKTRKRGFGSRLIESSITDELRGQIAFDFAPAGFSAKIELPLETFSS